jgi:hypothetical protein
MYFTYDNRLNDFGIFYCDKRNLLILLDVIFVLIADLRNKYYLGSTSTGRSATCCFFLPIHVWEKRAYPLLPFYIIRVFFWAFCFFIATEIATGTK